MPNQIYRIFLASSNELQEDREQFELFIGRQNNLLKNKHVYLQTVLWEDIGDQVYPTDKQNHYNEELKTCDIFVMLYWTKAGKYSNIEFDLAFAQLRYTGKHPVMFVFEKTAPPTKSVSSKDKSSLKAFQQKLKDYGQFVTQYDDADKLINLFKKNLDKLFADGHLKDGGNEYEHPAQCLYTDGNSVPVNFLGRDEELREIKEKLETGGSLMLINAEGGIGKTSLAAKYWDESLYNYKYNAWLFCENGIVQAIKKLAPGLGVDLAGMDEAGQLEALKRVLLPKANDFLLVLDNANEPKDIEDFKRAFHGVRWRVLITSRCSGLLEAKQEMRIDHLPPAMARELFITNYNENTPEFDDLLGLLLKDIHYHTLLVEIFSKNMQQLHGYGETLADFLKQLQGSNLFLKERSLPVATDYAISRHLEAKTTDDIVGILYDFGKLDETGRFHLVNFALLPAVNYELPFLADVFEQDKFALGAILRGLVEKGWIGHGENGYRINPVVQKLVLHKNEATLKQDAEKLVASLNKKLANDATYLTRLNYDEAAPFAQLAPGITKHLEKQPSEALGLLNFNTYVYHRATGDLPEAQKAAENYQVICELLDDRRNLALSYSNLGNIFADSGNLEKAMDFYQKFNDLIKQLHDADPGNVDFKNLLAISYSKLGETYAALGDLEKALDFYQKCNDLENQLHEADPSNVNFKNGLAISYQNLGITHSALGDLEKALGFYKKYSNLEKQLHETHPSNVNFKDSLAISYQYLGNTHSALGDLEKALDFYQKDIDLEKQLHEAFPENVNFKNGLAISYQNLGNTHSALGDLQKALGCYQEYNNLEKQLLDAYPGNVGFKNGLAISYSKLGETYTNLNDPEKALHFHQKDIELTEQLHLDYPDNVSFKNSLAISCCQLGSIYERRNETKAAIPLYRQAKVIWEQLVVISPQMAAYKRNLNFINDKLGKM